jgi:hypothetical protein
LRQALLRDPDETESVDSVCDLLALSSMLVGLQIASNLPIIEETGGQGGMRYE